MAVAEVLGAVLIVAGTLFFLAGSIGLLRFPDVYTRLHALTKADNAGLGLVAVGLALQAGSWAGAVELLLVWLLVLAASAGSSHLIARSALAHGIRPWSKP